MARNGSALKRFRIEAGLHMAVRHPNLPELYDADVLEDGTGVFVFEWLDCRDLDATVRCVRRMPLGDALFVAMQILRPLAPIQGKIIHRDIKPSNVFVCRQRRLDAEGRIDKELIRLLDFGVAKVAGGEAVTTDESIHGTLSYMSPEHIRGDVLDARSDLYAIGAVLYEMLAGHAVFPVSPDDDLRTVYGRYLDHVPADLRQETGLPDDVWRCITRLMAKNRDDRFAHAAAALDAMVALERAHRSTAKLFRDDIDDVVVAMDRLRADGWGTQPDSMPSSDLAAIAHGFRPTEPLSRPPVLDVDDETVRTPISLEDTRAVSK